jgi:hypothetical protein
LFHLADREPYRRLNDAVCVCTGEVRTPSDPAQPGPDLVIDVAELIWEPGGSCASTRPITISTGLTGRWTPLRR